MGKVNGVGHLPFLLSYCVLCRSHKPSPKFGTLQRSESLNEGTGSSVDGEADHFFPSCHFSNTSSASSRYHSCILSIM